MYKYNYIITIKEPDYKRADMVAFLMLLLATVFFGYVAVQRWTSKAYHNAAIMYALLVGVIVLWSLYTYWRAKKTDEIAFYRVALFVAAIGWYTEPVSNYWMAGLFALAAVLERQVKFPQEIGVDDKGITFNTLPSKEYEWKDINNLLLKEGMLTVDYKNNKLFQHEIESEVSKELEQEFNHYCQGKLASIQ